MTLDTLIMLFGVLNGLVAFSGFPPEWKDWMTLILAIAIVALGIVVRRRLAQHNKKPPVKRNGRRREIVESEPEIFVGEPEETLPESQEHVIAREERTEND